ncbi:hypothetical protein ACQKWADRAFT_283561 [Trichoderma austrokoningii]
MQHIPVLQHTTQLGHFNLDLGDRPFCPTAGSARRNAGLQPHPCTYIRINVTCRPDQAFTTHRKPAWISAVENTPKAYSLSAMLSIQSDSSRLLMGSSSIYKREKRSRYTTQVRPRRNLRHHHHHHQIQIPTSPCISLILAQLPSSRKQTNHRERWWPHVTQPRLSRCHSPKGGREYGYMDEKKYYPPRLPRPLSHISSSQVTHERR